MPNTGAGATGTITKKTLSFTEAAAAAATKEALDASNTMLPLDDGEVFNDRGNLISLAPEALQGLISNVYAAGSGTRAVGQGGQSVFSQDAAVLD